MKTIENFISALYVIAKYEPRGLATKYFLEAEHDVIYTHIEASQIAEGSVDGVRLIELGFHLDDDLGVWVYFT